MMKKKSTVSYNFLVDNHSRPDFLHHKIAGRKILQSSWFYYNFIKHHVIILVVLVAIVTIYSTIGL